MCRPRPEVQQRVGSVRQQEVDGGLDLGGGGGHLRPGQQERQLVQRDGAVGRRQAGGGRGRGTRWAVGQGSSTGTLRFRCALARKKNPPHNSALRKGRSSDATMKHEGVCLNMACLRVWNPSGCGGMEFTVPRPPK